MPSHEPPISAALREVSDRKWLAIAIAAVVSLLAWLASGGATTQWTSTAVLEVVDENPRAAALGLSGVFPYQSISAEAAGLRQLIRSRFDELSIIATVSQVDNQITLTTTADSSGAAISLQEVVDSFIEGRRDRHVDHLTTAIDLNARRIQELSKQITTVDETIGASGSESDVAILERLRTLDELNRARTQLAALELLQRDVDGGIRVVLPADEATSSGGPTSLSRLIAPMVLGLLVGAGVALARGRTDNRLRTRELVERYSGGVKVIGVIADAGPNARSSLDAFTDATDYLLSRTKCSRVVLIPVSAPEAAQMIATTAMNRTDTVSWSVGTPKADDDTSTVVIVAVDATIDRPADLQRLIHRLSALGVTPAAAVLHGVSSRNLVQASAGTVSAA